MAVIPQVVQLKITLENTSPEVWRSIQIFENSSLRTLHYAIQDIFWWKGYHSYLFKIGDDEYSDPDINLEFEGWLDDSKYKIGAITKKRATWL
jgi:hypothetical protein